MCKQLKTRIKLRPDSPESWTNTDDYFIGCRDTDIELTPPSDKTENKQYDPDALIDFIRHISGIEISRCQERLLREIIDAKNRGGELVYVQCRHHGRETVRQCMEIIDSLFNSDNKNTR